MESTKTAKQLASRYKELINQGLDHVEAANEIGMSKSGVFRVRHVWLLTESSSPEEAKLAKELIQKYDEGEYSPNYIYQIMRLAKKSGNFGLKPDLSNNQAKINDYLTQRKVIESAIRTLSGICYGIDQISVISSNLEKSELDRWIKELTDNKRSIERLLRSIRRQSDE